MTKERIEKAVEIIEYAIKNNISVKQASIDNGFSGTYVKNIKSQVNEKYDAGVLEDELYDLFHSAYEQYASTDNGNDEKGKPNINIGVDKELNSFGEKNLNNPAEEKTTYVDNGKSVEISYSGNDSILEEKTIKSLDDLLTEMKVDKSLWEVKSHIVNTWNTTAFNHIELPQGGVRKEPVRITNYQVKARLEQIKEAKDAIDLEKVIKELVKSHNLQHTNYLKRGWKPEENNLLEINLFDLHFGKLGWAGEVGENYDTKIAAARFMDAIKNLMARAQGFEISRILFPIGNDFFNSDNLHNTTTAGTPQDEDLRWQKTALMGCTLIKDGIELIKTMGVPVDVVVVPGNHDKERSFWMGLVMDAWFANDKQVNVNNHPSPRKYYEFGEVLLGLTHGNNEKEAALPLLMATEKKEEWGRTTFHEWHLGHFHRKRSTKYTVFDKAQILNEDLGVTVRYLSSLSGTEEWHHEKGYVGTQKAGEAFIWNDKIGQIAHLNFNFTNFDREH